LVDRQPPLLLTKGNLTATFDHSLITVFCIWKDKFSSVCYQLPP